MGAAIDLTGMRFTRLVAVERSGRTSSSGTVWRCNCDCGRQTMVPIGALRKGNTKSCGCLVTEWSRSLNKKHGLSNTVEYRLWVGMITRCTNPKRNKYQDYGGRGIVVCDRWRSSFEDFFSDMGHRPSPRHSIERINNDGNYEPTNCKWATKREQLRNTRRNRILALNGESHPLVVWTERLGVDKNTISRRIASGWSLEAALTTKGKQRV
jgi:hypothetical protein